MEAKGGFGLQFLYLSSSIHFWRLVCRDGGWHSGCLRGREQRGTWTHVIHSDICHAQSYGFYSNRKSHAAGNIFLQADNAEPKCQFGGAPRFGTKDSLLRRSMFHLMGFWSKIQRLLVCCLWYVTALVTPKPVTVQLQESFELCWFRMETGSHLSLWQCEDPQGEMLFLFWNGRMKANTPWARDAHAGLHFSGCFCQWISSMWLTTFSPWGPVPLDLSLTDEISFGSLPRLVWKIDVLIVPDQKYFPTFPFLFWPLLLAKSWSVSGSKLKFSITGIKNQKLSGKVFRAGWRIS